MIMGHFKLLMLLASIAFPSVRGLAGNVVCSNVELKVEKFEESRDGVMFDKFKVSEDTSKLIFDYTIPSSEVITFQWRHNGEHLEIPEGEVGHLYYEHSPTDNRISLYFKNPSAKYSGEYNLTVLSKNNGNILAESTCQLKTEIELLDMSYETIRETEGSPAELNCVSTSFPKPKKVSWTFWKNDKWEPIDDAILDKYKGISDATLKINNLTASHEGFYKCSIDSYRNSNSQKLDSALYVLRVRNPNAVYWPLIGIAIEVLILIITISVYEKKQYDKRKQERASEGKKLLDESAQPLMQPTNDKNVRV